MMRRTWMIALLLGLTFTAPAYAEVDAVTGATQVGAGTDKQARNDERVRKAMLKSCAPNSIVWWQDCSSTFAPTSS